jgi:hypothetical protein
MLHVRALIKADSVILFDPAGSSDSKLKARLLTHLQGNLKALHKSRVMEGNKRLQEWQEGQKDGKGGTNMTIGVESHEHGKIGEDAGLGLSYEHR